MRYRYLSIFFLLGAAAPAQAQTIPFVPFSWQQWYPQQLPALDAQVVALAGGDFLLVGLHDVNKTSSALSVVRTNAQGTALWSRWRPLRFALKTNDQLNSSPADPQGNVALSFSNRVVKLSSVDGDTAWTRSFAPQAGAVFQQRQESSTAPVVAADGHYTVAYSFVDTNPNGRREVRVAKLNQVSGQPIWNQDVLPLMPADTHPSLIALTPRPGGYLLLTESRAEVPGVAVLNETGTGTFRNITDLAPGFAYTHPLALATRDGGLVFWGANGSYNSIQKLTAEGSTAWSTVSNGAYQDPVTAAEDAQGNILVVASAYHPVMPGLGSYHSFLQRYTAAGSYATVREIPTNSYSTGGSYVKLLPNTVGTYTLGGFTTQQNPARTRELTLANIGAFAPLSQHRAMPQQPLQLFPNPAAGTSLQIGLPNGFAQGELTITNALGGVQWRQTIGKTDAGTLTIPVNQLAAGLYVVRLTDSNRAIYAARLVRP